MQSAIHELYAAVLQAKLSEFTQHSPIVVGVVFLRKFPFGANLVQVRISMKSTVLFTSWDFYGIIPLNSYRLDKLQFSEEVD